MTVLRDPSLDRVLGGRPHQAVPAVAAVALTVMLVMGTVVLVLMGGPRDGVPATTQPAVAAPGESVATEQSGVARVDRLALPQPTSYVDGVPVGYPHSVAGAIAAAYGYSRIASGLDVDTTMKAIELIADQASGWFTRARDELVDGLVAQRIGLGLSAVGPSASASLAITPTGYQVLSQTPGELRVLTLNIVSAVAVNGERTSGTVVLDWTLRWIGDRWRAVLPYDDQTHDALAVAPMTSAARATGWQEASGG